MTREGPEPRPRVPVLHLVTDDAVLARPDFRERARAAMEAGGPDVALHLRGHAIPGGILYGLAAELRGPARAAGALLVVNDRVDVAMAAGLDAVQVGERSLHVGEVRRLLGPGAWVGASIHDAAGASRAVREGSTWLFVGTVYATPSHPAHPGSGCGVVGRVAALVDVPVLGIGGVTVSRVGGVREAGAHGVAVIRGVWDVPDPTAAVRDYLVALA